MDRISVDALLQAMGLTWTHYRHAQLSVHQVLDTRIMAPESLDFLLNLDADTVAFTLCRVGGHRTGVVLVETFRASGEARQGVAPVEVLDTLYHCCPPLRSFPLGRLGRRATAVLMVDRIRRRTYVLYRDWFETSVRPCPGQWLDWWAAHAS